MSGCGRSREARGQAENTVRERERDEYTQRDIDKGTNEREGYTGKKRQRGK